MTSLSKLQTSNEKTNQGGMEGLIKLELEADKNSKTFVKTLSSKPPLLIQKALYPNQKLSNTAHIYIMSSAGGILQGDRLQIDITAKKNTKTHVTTQAATEIYKAENQLSFQKINISLENNSYLEFLPKQIIPHKFCNFDQEVNLRIDENSTLVYSETISSGRIAYGEKFDFTSLFLRLNAYNQNENLLFSEAMKLEPLKRKEKFQSIFGSKNIYSTIYIISKSFDSEKLDKEIFSALQKQSTTASCSQLPHESGVIVRILSDSIDDTFDLISKIANIIRMKLQSNLNL